MKEKIEKLIKEMGVKDVESKVNVKENLKKDFIDLLTGCTISFFCDDIEYRQDGKLICYYKKMKMFLDLDGIWLKLESKYNLNYQEMKELLVGIVEEVLNYKGVTPRYSSGELLTKWKRY